MKSKQGLVKLSAEQLKVAKRAMSTNVRSIDVPPSSKPESSETPPKWQFWLHMREVKLWEACLLSLNIDPKRIRPSRSGWLAGGPVFDVDSFRSREMHDDYNDRLRLLRSNLSSTSFTPGTLDMGNPNLHGVKLSEFAAWCAKVECDDIPAELSAIAKPPESPKPMLATNSQQARPPQQQVFQEQEILRVIDELGYAQKALPKNAPGKAGVKAEVRKQLSFTVGVFNGAWERLRAQKEIADATQ